MTSETPTHRTTLGRKQHQILLFLSETTWSLEHAIREGTGSTRPLFRELHRLLDKGLVERTQPRRMVWWSITLAGDAELDTR